MMVLDSSFLSGFHNKREAHHEPASALMERFLGGEWGRGLQTRVRLLGSCDACPNLNAVSHK